MSAAEYAATVAAVLLLIGNAAALYMWRRTRVQRDDALDAAETMLRGSERAIHAIGDELRTAVAERDAARAAQAHAETRERIAHTAWGRAVDKLLTPAPLTITVHENPEPVDWSTARGRHLVALDRESVLRG